MVPAATTVRTGEAGLGQWRRRRVAWSTAVCTLVLAAEAAASGEVVARRLLAMGTWLEIEVRASSPATARAASEAVLDAVQSAEQRLSTWRSDSELAAANRTPAGAWLPISNQLERDLGDALSCARRTGGAFSPAVGALVAAWDLRGGGRIPSAAEIERALPDSSPDGLEVRRGRVRRLRPGVAVEEGGFGKGAALRDAAAAALAAGAECAVLDFGGQVAVAGSCGTVELEIADPSDRERPVARVLVASGSVATSGGSERSVTVGGDRFHHVLDPRTGRPVPDWGSVTVLAEDPLTADCLATALVVLGPETATAWALGEPDIEVVIVRRPEGGSVDLSASEGLRGRLEPASTTAGVQWLERPPGEGIKGGQTAADPRTGS